MSESNTDLSAGVDGGGESSHDADVDAGFDDVEAARPGGAAGETVEDSAEADKDAGYDDSDD